MPRNDTRIRSITAERFTPCSLARKTKACALLESASFRSGRQRYSILLIQEALRVTQTKQGVYLTINGQRSMFPHAHSDILDVLQHFCQQHNGEQHAIPIPFGGIGTLSFEFVTFCDTVHIPDKDDPLQLPLAEFMLGHLFIIFDHYSDELKIVGINYNEHEVDLDAEIEHLLTHIHDMDFNYLLSDHAQYAVQWPSDNNRTYYTKMVTEIGAEIVKGNLLQAVPSHRLCVESALPPFTAYSRLRRMNPSPYMFYLDFGYAQLLGASPEMHVRSNSGHMTIRPIAGTRRRGKNAAEDAQIQKELLQDDKERAEHLMLIDLARNDFGRVCTARSIHIIQYMQVEYFARVMHIVSEIAGKLGEQYNALDAIRATFPAGTVSGAPKIQAINTIASIEKVPRRFYAGIVGYVKSPHTLDSCITIRSTLKIGNTFYLQAGGGVVYDSNPEREFEETREKLQSLVDVLQDDRV